MDRYGASSRHCDHDSDCDFASDAGRNYAPRSGGPPRRPLRGHPAPRGPTRGHGAHADPHTSGDEGDESDFDLDEFHRHDGHAGGARGADHLSSDNDLSEIEASGNRHRHVYGRGRAGGQNRDGPRIGGRANGEGRLGSTHFVSDHSDDEDDDDSDGEYLVAARGGRYADMRFDTDSSDEAGIHHGHFISHGTGGRRSTAVPYPPRRGPAPRNSSSSDESESDRHVAASRRGREATGAGARGRTQGDRRGAVRGGRL